MKQRGSQILSDFSLKSSYSLETFVKGNSKSNFNSGFEIMSKNFNGSAIMDNTQEQKSQKVIINDDRFLLYGEDFWTMKNAKSIKKQCIDKNKPYKSKSV